MKENISSTNLAPSLYEEEVKENMVPFNDSINYPKNIHLDVKKTNKEENSYCNHNRRICRISKQYMKTELQLRQWQLMECFGDGQRSQIFLNINLKKSLLSENITVRKPALMNKRGFYAVPEMGDYKY